MCCHSAVANTLVEQRVTAAHDSSQPADHKTDHSTNSVLSSTQKFVSSRLHCLRGCCAIVGGVARVGCVCCVCCVTRVGCVARVGCFGCVARVGSIGLFKILISFKQANRQTGKQANRQTGKQTQTQTQTQPQTQTQTIKLVMQCNAMNGCNSCTARVSHDRHRLRRHRFCLHCDHWQGFFMRCHATRSIPHCGFERSH